MQRSFSLFAKAAGFSLLLLACGSAQAQMRPSTKVVAGAHWLAADFNGDGVISKTEYLEFNRRRAEQAFERMDADHDGQIVPDELQAYYDNLRSAPPGADKLLPKGLTNK